MVLGLSSWLNQPSRDDIKPTLVKFASVDSAIFDQEFEPKTARKSLVEEETDYDKAEKITQLFYDPIRYTIVLCPHPESLYDEIFVKFPETPVNFAVAKRAMSAGDIDYFHTMFSRVWMVLKGHNIKRNYCPPDAVALPEGSDTSPEEIVLYSGIEKRVFLKDGYESRSTGIRYSRKIEH
eukprot:846087_1